MKLKSNSTNYETVYIQKWLKAKGLFHDKIVFFVPSVMILLATDPVKVCYFSGIFSNSGI